MNIYNKKFNEILVFNNYVLCSKITQKQSDNMFLMNEEIKDSSVIKGKIIFKSNNSKIQNMNLNIGDIILFSSFSALKYNTLEKEYFFIDSANILAKIVK